MITEVSIIERIKYLQGTVRKLKGKLPSELSKVEYLDYYCTLSRIDELVELLPKTHWFRKEMSK